MNKKLLLLLLGLLIIKTGFTQVAKERGLHASAFISDGIERTYRYYIPENYEPEKKPPLVFFLHGFGNNSQGAADVLGPYYHPRADRDNAIVVYPEAVAKHWNDLMGGNYPATDSIDDVKFISSLIDFFIKNYGCDPARVYISGSSNGGLMTYRLSCAIPEKITAIAPFISAMSPQAAKEFANAKPLPVIITSGTADSVIKWEGGPVRVINTPQLLSAEKNIEYWKARNHTAENPEVTRLPDICPEDNSTVEKYHYKGKYDVVLYKVINGTHQHPTLRKAGKPLIPGQNCDYNSFETVWDFLLSYKK